jgi:signal transduction histidine kinase
VDEQRADIEHRIRTELTTLSIAAQLLGRDPSTTGRQRRLAQDIIAACDRLQAWVQELLDERFSERGR